MNSLHVLFTVTSVFHIHMKISYTHENLCPTSGMDGLTKPAAAINVKLLPVSKVRETSESDVGSESSVADSDRKILQQ